MDALVHTATTLPTVLLAMPGGVLADILNRTRLLIGVQLFVAVVAIIMAWLAAMAKRNERAYPRLVRARSCPQCRTAA